MIAKEIAANIKYGPSYQRATAVAIRVWVSLILLREAGGKALLAVAGSEAQSERWRQWGSAVLKNRIPTFGRGGRRSGVTQSSGDEAGCDNLADVNHYSLLFSRGSVDRSKNADDFCESRIAIPV
jgi:hypothetical protein